MPAASRPASAYIAFGLLCSMKRSGSVSVLTFRPRSRRPSRARACSRSAPNPPVDPSSMVMSTSWFCASLRSRSISRGLAKRASATVVDKPKPASWSAASRQSTSLAPKDTLGASLGWRRACPHFGPAPIGWQRDWRTGQMARAMGRCRRWYSWTAESFPTRLGHHLAAWWPQHHRS